MVSIDGFRSSCIQHDVHFVNDALMEKTGDKVGYALGRG